MKKFLLITVFSLFGMVLLPEQSSVMAQNSNSITFMYKSFGCDYWKVTLLPSGVAKEEYYYLKGARPDTGTRIVGHYVLSGTKQGIWTKYYYVAGDRKKYDYYEISINGSKYYYQVGANRLYIGYYAFSTRDNKNSYEIISYPPAGEDPYYIDY